MERSTLHSFQPDLPDGVSFEDRGDRLRLSAERELTGLASGSFAEPSASVAFTPTEVAPGPESAYVGFSFGQFALPVRGGPGRPFEWSPAANVAAPPAVIPLLIRGADGLVTLLAPLDAWHDQIIAVDQDDAGVRGFRWGWHGDLDRLPARTTATLGIYRADGVAGAFNQWRADLVAARPDGLPTRPADPVTTHLSYWTDNGAAYWYRTEPGQDLPTTLAAKLSELDELDVPIGSVELDSWFYRHEIGRPVSEVGYLEEVPPTGMVEWAPRSDVLPDGVAELGRRLGDRPLVLHARHISASSPYLAEGDWWVGDGPDRVDTAHPADPAFFQRLAADARAWGASCIEQDWMPATWFGVRELRAEPGRAAAWQQGLDAAAARHDLTLLWCMPTPADLLATVDLNRIAAVRTCDDYRYADDPARLWRWYLTVNRLAATLDLPVSKDCFFTEVDVGPDGSEIDGDPNAEVEALLSAFSAGVVGIGDRIGRTDTAIVRRLCRPDGVLIQPDQPLALADASFFATPDEAVPMWAETSSSNAAGRWRYVAAIHGAATDDPISGSFDLGGRHLVYDWRSETADVLDRIELTLAYRDWALLVCCPLPTETPGGRTVIGDPTALATMGRNRIEVTAEGAVRPILAASEDALVIRFWDPAGGLTDETRS